MVTRKFPIGFDLQEKNSNLIHGIDQKPGHLAVSVLLKQQLCIISCIAKERQQKDVRF